MSAELAMRFAVVTEDGIVRYEARVPESALMFAVSTTSGATPVRLESACVLPESADGWAHFAAVVDQQSGRTITVVDGKVVAS